MPVLSSETIMNAAQWIGLICGGLFLAVIVFMFAVIAFFRYRRSTNLHLRHWLRAKRGGGSGIGELARRLNVDAETLRSVNVDYVESFIPKRSGGTRRLLIPNDELKQLQRRILRRLLAKLQTHSAVTGFEPGLSIVENALPHVGQAVVIKLDIVDFFPNTRVDRIDYYFRRIGWDAECAELLTRLTTYDGGLPQGAPTSPRLSNLVNFGLDRSIERFAVELRRGTFTRYADDITISFSLDYSKRVRGILQAVRKRLRRYGYELNISKVRILRRHQQQRVTGLVVNDQVNIPRRQRRMLRAVEHRLNSGKQATMTREQLDGWKALLRMVEQRRDRRS